MTKKDDLNNLRNQIDEIDSQILNLLKNRLSVARAVGEAKQKLSREGKGAVVYYDPGREQKVLDRLERQAGEEFPKGSIKAVFKEIISTCRSVQAPMKVAFLGPRGTYTQMAAHHVFGLTAQYVDCPSIGAVFDSVDRGEVTFGVVPIENSSEGGVAHTLDELCESNLKIHRELILRVRHCLAGRNQEISKIRRIYSHPQALSQCRNWITANLPDAQLISTNSTAEAGQAAKEDPESAAIISELGAEVTGLNIIRREIQNKENNATRFVLLHKSNANPTGHDKTSLVFSVKGGAGSLVKVLALFKENDINLTRIESRASREDMWDYIFFIDLEGHQQDQKVQETIRQLESVCPMVKILGSYPMSENSQPMPLTERMSDGL